MPEEVVETTEETMAPTKKRRRKTSSSKTTEPVETAPTTEPVAEEAAPTPARPVARFPVRARTFTFDQWAKRRGVAAHHKGGLRAYVRDVGKSRTLEEWDECFKDY